MGSTIRSRSVDEDIDTFYEIGSNEEKSFQKITNVGFNSRVVKPETDITRVAGSISTAHPEKQNLQVRS